MKKTTHRNSADLAHEAYWAEEQDIGFNDYERNWVLPQLFKKNEKVLDLGCGDGAVGGYLVENFNCKVTGLDFSKTALNRAQKRGLKPVLGSANDPLPFNDKTFDMVFFGDVIEHIYSPENAIKEISRILKPKGRLILSCPNMGYWRYRLHYLFTGLFPETEWIEKDLWSSQHIRFFNKQLLYQLLNKHQLKPQKFIGVSRRRLDQPILKFAPELGGMIMVIEAVKS